METRNVKVEKAIEKIYEITIKKVAEADPKKLDAIIKLSIKAGLVEGMLFGTKMSVLAEMVAEKTKELKQAAGEV